jgi:hypothetical protein
MTGGGFLKPPRRLGYLRRVFSLRSVKKLG